MTRVVRSLRNGQVTIPADFRRALGIEDDSLLHVTLAQGELRMRPVKVEGVAAGSPWLKELYDQFAPAREAASRYAEHDIDADIDRAVIAVRRKRA